MCATLCFRVFMPPSTSRSGEGVGGRAAPLSRAGLMDLLTQNINSVRLVSSRDEYQLAEKRQASQPTPSLDSFFSKAYGNIESLNFRAGAKWGTGSGDVSTGEGDGGSNSDRYPVRSPIRRAPAEYDNSEIEARLAEIEAIRASSAVSPKTGDAGASVAPAPGAAGEGGEATAVAAVAAPAPAAAAAAATAATAEPSVGSLTAKLSSLYLPRSYSHSTEDVIHSVDERMKIKAAREAVAAEAKRAAVAAAAAAGEGQRNKALRKRKRGLPAEADAAIDRALEGGPAHELLFTLFNADISREKFRCLLPLTWLNDEVINLYIQLMGEDDKALCKLDDKRLPSHFFNSFFFAKLTEDGYNFMGVRRWTRGNKVVGGDIFKCDKVIIPVNVGNMHWCLAVIYVQKKVVQYYDSMGGSGEGARKALMRWLADEHVDKLKRPMDTTGWQSLPPPANTPQQQNGCDCGVFAVSFASYISEDLPITEVRQADMTAQRRRIAWALLSKAGWA